MGGWERDHTEGISGERESTGREVWEGGQDSTGKGMQEKGKKSIWRDLR